MKSRSLLNLKKLILILILGLISNQLLAQNNIGIFFQAVARDNYSNPAKSRKIYIQSSVIQSSATGTKVLIEEHQANTDATGMFNISIGNGNRVGGSATGFSSIDWSNGPFFLNLKVAITPMSGVTGWDYTKEWVDMGTTSFGAVPYALYAANAAGVNQKLNISDTSNMLSVYAKAMALQNLATTVNTKLSLSDSLTKYVTPTMLAANAFDSTSLSNRINLKANATDLNTSLATKVDKITGKELSTNDYTTAEKTKLAAITGTNTGDQDLSALATNAALALKANATDVNTSLATKANTADVTTALALKANTVDVTTALATKANTADVITALATKVDKVTGKELSTNDYTTAEKSKLAAITGTNTGDQDLSALATNAALALKANTTDVTTALNLKANTADVNTAVATKANTTDVNTALATKVDKVTGKALSTNDYTTAEKSKLAAITGTNTGDQDLSALATNAALALKANTTDVNTALTLKANTSSLSTVATSGSYNDLSNKPTIPSAYTLPTASASVLGGVKVGSNLSVDGNGVLSANINAGSISGTVTVANGGTGATTLTGLVKGNGTNALTAAVAGTDYQAPLTLATTGTGAATFSGTTLTIPTYSLPIADATNLGGVKVGSNLSVDANGVLTANINAGTLTGTTLAANVVNSSLTSVGTVTSGTFSLTTDITTSGTLKAGAVTYPNIHGTNGQVLTTTGSGTLSWTSIASPDLTNYVTTNTAQTITSAKTFSETTTFSKDLAVNGITVGRGGGNESTNTAIGTAALTSNTTGNSNTAVGMNALSGNITGTFNTAIGNGANVGSGALTNATAIGNGASVTASNTIQLGNASVTDVKTNGNLTVNGITVGKGGGNQGSNIAFGTTALTSNTSGGSNTAIGHRTLSNNLAGGDNTAVGANALRFNTGDFSQLKGTYNTALGSSSLNANTEGSYNTATGANALSSNSTGNSNTAIGYNSLSSNTGSNNTAVGQDALRGSKGTGRTNNTAIGYEALRGVTLVNNILTSTLTGTGNTAVGHSAGQLITTGSNNTAIGHGANVASGTFSNTTAIGNGAIVTASNTIQLGNTDVTNLKTAGTITAGAVTYPNAVLGNQNGNFLTIVTDGTNPVGAAAWAPLTLETLVGTTPTLPSSLINSSLQTVGTITAGVWNGTTIAIANGGTGSNTKNFVDLTTAQSIAGVKTFTDDAIVNGLTVGKGRANVISNTAIGGSALSLNTDGSFNTAIGYRTLLANTTGYNNTATGADALTSNTTGLFNTAYGSSTLLINSTGYGNTAIGTKALINNETGTLNTAIGYDAGVSGSNTNLTNTTAIGNGARVTESNTIQLGNTDVTNVKTSGTLNAAAVFAGGMQLTSDLRLKSNITPLANSLATVMQLNPVHYMKKSSLASTAYSREENGFIAQEIQKILPFVVTEGTDENKLLSVDYNSFIPMLTKAIQEQQKQIEDQNAKIAAQQKQIEELIKLMKELKK